MNRWRALQYLVFLLLLSSASILATAQSMDQPIEPPGPRPSPQAIQQWKSRKFGMFIHFGPYSMLGGVWHGKEIKYGYSEQIMSHARISRDDYAKAAQQFDPVNFNADAIVELAQAAGMKFIVITAKHHDGFNMFHTKLTNYNIVDDTRYGKDIVKELADACARHGMKFGVYFSTIDWHYPGAIGYSTTNDRNDTPIPKAHEDFNVGQLTELTTNYGPLSEIWFDMGKPTPAQSKRFADTVHKYQPNCMVSGRVFNYQGDFNVMGDNQVPKFIMDEPWQTPASIYPDTWGYRSWEKRTDLPGKIDEKILNLVQVVSRGGNYILNIGPKGDGSVVPYEANVLRGIGAWMKINGDAIYGTQPQPFRELSFGYATVKPHRLYLFIRQWPDDNRLSLPGLQTHIQKAYFLADPQQNALHIDNTANHEAVYVTGKQRTAPLTVVVAEYAGKLDIIPPVTRPDTHGAIVLESSEADHFYNYNGYGYEDPPTIYKEKWAIAPNKGGKYRIELTYRKPSSPGKVDITIGSQVFPVTLNGSHADTADPSLAQTSADIVTLKSAPFYYVEITPPEPFIKGTRLPVDLISVELHPVN